MSNAGAGGAYWIEDMSTSISSKWLSPLSSEKRRVHVIGLGMIFLTD
jgi:hypothetical protein